MDDGREVLRRRFASGKAVLRTRRADYKGHRSRLNLRIADEMAIALQLIKLATGEPKNGFGVRVLEKAVQESIRELRTRYGDEAWKAFEERARALHPG